jgi:nucleoside-diphosphate-sugar epimerase
MIVVSGASGMVGSQIVLALLEAGMGPVRGLYRSPSSLDSARRSWEFQGFGHRWDEVDWHRADLEDPSEVENALEGAHYAVHAAALVSFRKKDEHLMLRGTPLLAEHMVNAALHHGLKGLVHISSVAVLQGTEIPLDESVDPQRKGLNAYARSKFDAEMQARRGEVEGHNVLIVNPSVVLGLPFWADGSSRLLRSAAKGLPAVPGGSTGWVDVRDVAASVVHGLRNPSWGERYILSGSNQSFEAFYGGIADRLGKRRAPVVRARWPFELAWRLLALVEALGGPTAQLTKDSVKAATSQGGYRNDKAQAWGIPFRPFDETLDWIASAWT